MPADACCVRLLRTSPNVVEIVERSIASKELGTVLNLLWVPVPAAYAVGMALDSGRSFGAELQAGGG